MNAHNTSVTNNSPNRPDPLFSRPPPAIGPAPYCSPFQPCPTVAPFPLPAPKGLHRFSMPPPPLGRPPPFPPPNTEAPPPLPAMHFNYNWPTTPHPHPPPGPISGFAPIRPSASLTTHKADRDLPATSHANGHCHNTCDYNSSSDCRHPQDRNVFSYKRNQAWVDVLLSQCKDARPVCSEHEQFQDVQPRKLSQVHKDVARYQQLLAALKASPDGNTTGATLKELAQLAETVSSPEYVNSVQKLVQGRRRQRARRKKRKISRKIEFQEKHKEIDALREVVVKREKKSLMEESLRREADSVLKEVRSKQAEAQSRLSVLGRLGELRHSRLRRGGQGVFVATEKQTRHYGAVTKGLKDMLLSQLKEYELEERTLKAMLELHNPQQCQSFALAKKVKFPHCHALREMYFGRFQSLDVSLLSSYTSADDSLEMLINRRRLWDKFISEKDGSSVPVAWVLPGPSAGRGWAEWNNTQGNNSIADRSNFLS